MRVKSSDKEHGVLMLLYKELDALDAHETLPAFLRKTETTMTHIVIDIDGESRKNYDKIEELIEKGQNLSIAVTETPEYFEFEGMDGTLNEESVSYIEENFNLGAMDSQFLDIEKKHIFSVSYVEVIEKD